MTARQKADANDQRQDLFTAAGWASVVSGKPLSLGVAQLAHRVAKTKANMDKWGPEVINHPMNLVPVLDLRENAFCNIAGQKVKADELVRDIIRVNTGIEPMPDMREYYADLREEFRERWKS